MQKFKLLSFVAVLLFGVTTASAQINQGSFLIGGTASFDFNSSSVTAGDIDYDGASSLSVGLQPRLGFFIADNILPSVLISTSISTLLRLAIS